ncbi:MAG: beta-lactamase family protein [Thermomicrobiales bacterium]|nr:beta-lactamase family protein [Thermomicrobiales bacterium]
MSEPALPMMWHAPNRGELRETIAAVLRTADAPGAAVALVVDGRPTLSVGVGHRNLARDLPLDAAARTYAYSITKTMLAVAALRLAETGRLMLDAPIRAILPDAALSERATLRRLLNHTAGVPDYGAMPEHHAALRADPTAPWTSAEFLDRTLPGGLRFPPGEGWGYSNIGYLLVRLAIERTTGQSLRTALVFRPAAMRQTCIAESLADAAGLTPGYSILLDRDGALRDMTRRYHPGWVSHGAAIATAADLTRFLEALFSDRLLRPESLATMLEVTPVPGAHPPFVRPAYGLGLMIDLGSPWGTVAGHAGSGPGYATAAFHATDAAGRRVTSAALVNRDGSDAATRIAFALIAACAQGACGNQGD